MKTQKALVLFLAMALVVFGFGAMAQAGDNTTQTVTFDVPAINEITVSGNPEKLVIITPTAGNSPADVTDSSTTYNITTNETGKKITAKIDTGMPTGTTLKVNLTAPSVGTSQGDVTLGTTDAAVVIGIGQVADNAKTIKYTLHADLTSGELLNQTKIVTFTIADES